MSEGIRCRLCNCYDYLVVVSHLWWPWRRSTADVVVMSRTGRNIIVGRPPVVPGTNRVCAWKKPRFSWEPFLPQDTLGPKGGRKASVLELCVPVSPPRYLILDSGKQKAHKHKSVWPVTVWWGVSLPVGCPGVKDLCAVFGTQGT